ncbi:MULTISPECIES: hypothetical protein [Ramlibacter]|uniref:Uncharacterized protein n=1 Tax=Ramlibacter pinisoli TaxID=2682844 RepID=A0A6N8IYG9_9BURK|nr:MULTISPECIES: hypothetical protein [Ramlibacter]MBA2961692.1 hypothetical protein [Ramlibacter sp. CGMCC 1.13660]MVQ31635.1 hypothetical protein [Ramlibacter pinisoli]
MRSGLLVLAMLVPSLASAHVKWFAASWDPSAAPVGLDRLLASHGFLAMFLLTLAVVVASQFADRRLAARQALQRFLAAADLKTARFVPWIIRLGLVVYFTSIALYFRAEPIILTPELKSGVSWMPMVQLAIACGLLLRRGVMPACVLIVALYGYAAHRYGWVHMLDYTFFLGVVALLSLEVLYGERRAGVGMLVLRITVATSFMWVAAEKWIYPDWTHEILSSLLPPVLTGFDVHFSCTAAGFVELALAFFILFGRTAAPTAAVVLLSFLLAAIPFVGPVDAIGHMPLVVALAVLAVTKNHLLLVGSARQVVTRLGAFLFPTTVVVLLVSYYYSHAAAIASGALGHWPATLSHVALAAAAGYWATYALYGVVAERRSHLAG